MPRPCLRPAKRPHRPSRRLGTGVACLVAAGLVLSGASLVGCSGDGGGRKTLEAFLRGWPTGKLEEVGFVSTTGEKIAASDVAEQIRKLSGELAKQPPTLKIAGDPKQAGNIETYPVAVDWPLPAGGRWTYTTSVQVSEGEQGWRLIWEPAVVHSQLTSGDELVVRRQAAPRATILDAAGRPIVEPRPVILVGIQPSAVTDVTKLVKELDAAFKSVPVPVDLSDVPAQVAKARASDQLVEVVRLRKTDYQRIRDRIQPLPGTRFHEETRDLAVTRVFARALLGVVDEVQKDDMDAKPGVYDVGDMAGHGGLQERYEDRLRGSPGQRVLISRTAPDGTVSFTEIGRIAPKPGASLKTTLDQRVQNAADAALSGESRRTALVAVRVADGSVLAAANGPQGGAENLAFTALVPPGSTFKMVSALGLLDAGAVGPDTKVPCPQIYPVQGKPFKNADNRGLGTVPFRVNFARSCNTAFAYLAPRLGADGLATAGASLGIGGAWDLGTDAFSGKVSTGGPAVERAAAAFGQGTTVVSPLAMAAATAAVAHGQWQQPKVLLDPAPAKPAPPGPQLKAESVAALRTMMREVVTAGTATPLADVPGGAVYGKTGTAEYDGNPAHTHAWFVGWQGDVAFAVFVEKGGSSAATAVPIAERFLRRLATS
ncbi:MAG TPA: penicillin-binding transpeptidase domain-containing protein [Pilimelia sp.]|nr:penicillin-binding transpeptidase domain-containing protein [Pilimelia sp.]